MKDGKFEEPRVEVTNTQLNKLKSAAKNKTRSTLRITKKNFQDEEWPHELFLTTRQKAKIRNVFANNMSTDVKLNEAQLSKIIQSGGFLDEMLGNMIGNLGEKSIIRPCHSFGQRCFA